MRCLVLKFLEDELPSARYAKARLLQHEGLQVEVKNEGRVLSLFVQSASEHLPDVCKEVLAEVVSLFYKYRFMKTHIEDKHERFGTAFDALMGALLSFDSDIEKKRVVSQLEDAKSYCVESVFWFRHQRILEEWKNLANLANRLVQQCDGEEELYEIIFFLLAIDKKTAPALLVKGQAGRRTVLENGAPVVVANLCLSEETNLLYALLAKRPKSIVLDEPKTFSSAFLACVNSLAEK